MDIRCKVDGQKLRILTPIRHFPIGSNDFVRFLFEMSDDWNGLMTFAQFRQGSGTSSSYLTDVTVTEDGQSVTYPSVTLPKWPNVGPITMTLYGTGQESVIGTTNYVVMHIDATGFLDAETSDMDETLYQQLVNRVLSYEASHRVFLSAAEMTQDESLKAGDIVRTRSYYEDRNFGGADYVIVTSNEPGTIPPGTIPLANGFYAEVRGGKVYPEQLGAYRDGTHDDTAAIQKAIDTGKRVGLSAGTYLVIPGSTYDHSWYRQKKEYRVTVRYALKISGGTVVEGDSGEKSVLQLGGPGYAIWMDGTYLQFPQIRNFRINGDDDAYNDNEHEYDYNGIFIAQKPGNEIKPTEAGYSPQTFGSSGWGACCVVENFYMRRLHRPFYAISAFSCNFKNGTLRWCGSSVFTNGRNKAHAVESDAPVQPFHNDFCNCCVFESIHWFGMQEVLDWVPGGPGQADTYFDVNGKIAGQQDYNASKAYYKGGYFKKKATTASEYADGRFVKEPIVRLDCASKIEFNACNFEHNAIAIDSNFYCRHVTCKDCHFEGIDYIYRTADTWPVRVYDHFYKWIIGYQDNRDAATVAAADAVALPDYIKRLFRRNMSDHVSLDFTKFSPTGINALKLYRDLFLQAMDGCMTTAPRAERHNVFVYDHAMQAKEYDPESTEVRQTHTLSLLRKNAASSIVWDVQAQGASRLYTRPQNFFFYRFGTDYSEINVPQNNKYVEDYNVSGIVYRLSDLNGEDLNIGMICDVYLMAYKSNLTYCAKVSLYKWREYVFASEPVVLTGGTAFNTTRRFYFTVDNVTSKIKKLRFKTGYRKTYDQIPHVEGETVTYPYNNDNPPVVGTDGVLELYEEGDPAVKYAFVEDPVTVMSMSVLYQIDRCPGSITPTYRVEFEQCGYGDLYQAPDQMVKIAAKVKRPVDPIDEEYIFVGWSDAVSYVDDQWVYPIEIVTDSDGRRVCQINKSALWDFTTRTLTQDDIDADRNCATIYAIWVNRDDVDRIEVLDA